MNTVQHLAKKCLDPKTTEEFYAKHLGFKRVRTFRKGEPNEIPIIRLGGFCLELFAAPEGTQLKKIADPDLGFGHLAFNTDDIEGAAASLKKDGVEVEDIIDCDGLVKGMRIVFFYDPDGNRIELMENYSDE